MTRENGERLKRIANAQSRIDQLRRSSILTNAETVDDCLFLGPRRRIRFPWSRILLLLVTDHRVLLASFRCCASPTYMAHDHPCPIDFLSSEKLLNKPPSVSWLIGRSVPVAAATGLIVVPNAFKAFLGDRVTEVVNNPDEAQQVLRVIRNGWGYMFLRNCREMHIQKEANREFQPRGKIVWNPNKHCPQRDCPSGNCGMFEGVDLDSTKLYETVTADYCPFCETAQLITTEFNFDAKLFLPLLKQKLRDFPVFEQNVTSGAPCPKCNTATRVFYKDLGARDFYENTWRVCPNPQCVWSGEHDEHYETNY